MSARGAELEATQADLAVAGSELAETETLLKASAAERTAKAAALEATQTKLADAQRLADMRDEQILRLQSELLNVRYGAATELERSTSEISLLTAKLEQFGLELEAQRLDHAAVLDAKAEAELRAAGLSQQLSEAGRSIDAILSSTSWKLTRPVRAAKSLRRRLREDGEIALVRESGLFDRDWYLTAYRDVAESGVDPLIHFVRYGGLEGRCPSPHFDSRYYLISNDDVRRAGRNPLVHYIKFGRAELRSPIPQRAALAAAPARAELRRHDIAFEQDEHDMPSAAPDSASLHLESDPAYEALSSESSAADAPVQSSIDDGCKLVAFYLPQFHRVRENSEWWSPGFTEWTNVSRGRPNFDGHYQPHIPRELGFYDLGNVSTLREQVAMAKLYGVSGFCFYHYWFSGRRILERPVELFLQSDIDFNFCLCWANENWTRTWDGDTKSVLLAQEYSENDALAFFEDILPALKDRRCIQVDGVPLLLVYRAKEIPRAEEWFDLWRSEARRHGLGGLHISVVDFYDITHPEEVGADSLVEFPPHKFNGSQNHPDRMPSFTNPEFAGGVVDYVRMIVQSAKRPAAGFQLFRGIIPSWDNTARRQNTPTIIVNARPDLFGVWLAFLRRFTRLQNSAADRRLIFVNAWNEWGEGCHLEPDMKWGLSYLEETLSSSITSKADPSSSLDEAVAALQYEMAECLENDQAKLVEERALSASSSADGLAYVRTVFQDHEIPGPLILKVSGALRRWPRVHAAVRQSYRYLRQRGRST